MNRKTYPPLVAIAVIAFAAGCGSAGKTGNSAAGSTAGSARSVTASAAPSSLAGAAPSSLSCADRVTSWWLHGGASQALVVESGMQSLEQDMKNLSTGQHVSQAAAAVRPDASALESGVRTARANPAPSCAPGVRADENAAMTDASQGARDCLNRLSAASGGVGTQSGDIEDALTAFQGTFAEYQKAAGIVEALHATGS
jgi:hypothetical protein